MDECSLAYKGAKYHRITPKILKWLTRQTTQPRHPAVISTDRFIKRKCPPNPDEIAGFIKSKTTTEDGGAIIDMGDAPDGCLPVSLYLYDECSICKVLTNNRFRLYPSDNNLNRLKDAFGSDFMIK